MMLSEEKAQEIIDYSNKRVIECFMAGDDINIVCVATQTKLLDVERILREHISRQTKQTTLCIDELSAKIQYLVDGWPVPLEDGCMTFPDGDRWETTNANPGK